ncbi:hypothetical protein JW756_03420 [Candidatus Woesearchaeota archaeon]|nr:hypothetical protein [Candidatus Woesearchaeota archaeon]
MAFSKSFAKTTEKSMYPKWVEVFLTAEEEREEEKKCREENIKIMRECIDDARKIFSNEKLRGYETSLMSIAIALFEKRASHAVYWKESKAKDKFDSKNSKE